MLKIKDYKKQDEEKFDELVKKYGLDTEADSDYESGWSYYVAFDDGIFIDYYNGVDAPDCYEVGEWNYDD